MRLLTATQYFESHRGGIEIVAGRLARELSRRGLDVTWLATDATPPPADLRAVALAASNVLEGAIGIPYPLLAPSAWRAIAREVARADAVLVHDGLYLTSIAVFAAARRHGKPVLMVQHVGAVPYRNPLLRHAMAVANRAIARPLLARADQAVFISATTARYFAGLHFRAPPELIFNGVDPEIFSSASDADERRATRRRHGLPEDGPVALFVGRFVEKKGLSVLERLARARPDVAFAFAGWGPLDPRSWKLANVRVFDQLSGAALAPLYRASDVLVLPSMGEGFPLVIQEALACGLAVLCGEESAQADPAAAALLTGVPVDADDPAATARRFGAALARMLGEWDAPAQRVTRAKFARERYAWPRAAARYAEILARIVAERRLFPSPRLRGERDLRTRRREQVG